ncbi:hypothetical protein HYR69_06320 [Candidatus Sumerlaeota bacterium]|nr:hypothetical protein [Candidatus Sumerlaeota bacterium]
MSLFCEIDSASLGVEESEALRALLALSAAAPRRAAQPRDLESHHLEIEDETGIRTFDFPSNDLPEGTRPLIRFLRKQSEIVRH